MARERGQHTYSSRYVHKIAMSIISTEQLARFSDPAICIPPPPSPQWPLASPRSERARSRRGRRGRERALEKETNFKQGRMKNGAVGRSFSRSPHEIWEVSSLERILPPSSWIRTEQVFIMLAPSSQFHPSLCLSGSNSSSSSSSSFLIATCNQSGKSLASQSSIRSGRGAVEARLWENAASSSFDSL